MSAVALLAMASGDSSDFSPASRHPDDPTRLDRLRQGDERALESLFVELADPLAAFARRIGVGAEDAEQVVVDVFHDLWQRRTTLSQQIQLTPYLFRAVRNRALDRVRADTRRTKYEATAGGLWVADAQERQQPNGDVDNETRDAVEMVRSTIQTLPESQRTALYLRYTRELPLADVASVMDISVGAVKMLLQRATRLLRERAGGVFERL